MMATQQSTLDKWFMRTKDFLLIIGFVGGVLLFGVKIYNLPNVVEAQAIEIQNVKNQASALDARLSKIEISQDYTNKGIDEIKSWLKTTRDRRP